MSKADPDDLKDLDLLVLPELAFSGTSLTERDSMAGHELDAAFVANVYTSRADSLAGYDFKSLRQIAPFLEPSGSGISSLWARTTALRYNTTVVVGYPEKVDVTPTWPTSPEYYNSAIVVNQDGQTIGNYRKSFLYRTDETWALEGRDGFFQGEIPGLGQTVMGICKFLIFQICHETTGQDANTLDTRYGSEVSFTRKGTCRFVSRLLTLSTVPTDLKHRGTPLNLPFIFSMSEQISSF